MRTSDSIRNRLFRHDCRIAINLTRATFSGWHDRLIVTAMLLVALAVVRAWFADRAWTTAFWAAFGAGIFIGIGAGRLVLARLAFHRFDGLLAADALHPPTRRRYIAAWHGVGVAPLAAIMLIARPSLLIVGIAAYLIGALAAGLTGSVRLPRRIVGNKRPGWTIRAWLRRPEAGIVAAIILVVSLLPARTLDTNALMAIVGIETLLLSLILTIVDHATVRFMAIAGRRSRRIVFDHAKAVATFAAIATPACWFALGSVAAGMVAAISIAMLLLLTMRLFAYCLHGKRFADFLVAILAGLLALVAYFMPILLPLIALAILLHLQRRGAANAWLLP